MVKMTDRDALISNNTGLVHACAGKFVGKGVEYEELYSCGCVGLVKAADNFDPQLGFRFSTYAVPVILGEIKRIFRDSGSIKVSRGLRELSIKINRAREEYTSTNGEEPTLSQLAEILGVSTAQIAQALEASQQPVSLCASSSDDEDDRQIDVAVCSHEKKLTERLALYQALDTLEQRDRQLIELRFFRGKTQSAAAEELSMTQVQVSRREKKILALLRERLSA